MSAAFPQLDFVDFHRRELPRRLGAGHGAIAAEAGLVPVGALEGAPLAMVQRNALRLLQLVNGLLDFARIEAGRVEASYQLTDLPQLTADLTSLFRSAVEGAGLSLRVDCPPLGASVYVDRVLWERIVLNLLSNALKFTFQGEIAVSLR